MEFKEKPMGSKVKIGEINLKPSVKPDQFIIAIGASAGGMEAINTLFDNTPTDGVSYVIIQHLSPDYKSLMAALLVKHSKLKIYEVEHEMEVLSNCVYVMPEGKNMTIVGGKLMLNDRESSTPNSAVDIFFNSLAEDQGSQSIAIVLAGNGLDGTKGIASIKKVGGLVIIQNPDSTEYNSMPGNAIASGYFDYILSPQLIPQQIINYIKQRTLTDHFSEPVSDKDEASLKEVMKLIKQHTPLDFSEYKRPTIVRRIIRRVIACNVNSIDEYIKFLKSNPSEIEILSKEFLISVTRFFRDQEAFEIIRNKVIPEIIEGKLLVDTLKIWVIGCATGEEAYSLAILIKEHLIEIKKDMEVKIFASDIDKDALTKASRGHYAESISRDVSENRLKTFFIKEGTEYKVRENIRNMIIFADHDIVHQPPYGKIDLITCRNLLIYLNPALQKRIFSTLHFCLNIGGYLFLGPSEGIGDLKDVFIEIDKKWKIYKNIEGTYKLGFNPYTTQQVKVKQYTYPAINIKSSKSNLEGHLIEVILQSHLEQSGFIAGVCIDENNKIILPFGKFENFLLTKLFNNDLLELLPFELAIAVGSSIKKVISDHVKVTVRKIIYSENESLRSVKILVKPFLDENRSLPNVFIIYFAEEEIESNADEVSEVFNKEFHTNRYLLGIEQELSEVKIKLQNAYQALEESNDNIQSYNEELLSGNEEMQSSNEELQSINEELHTVNSEYQIKIKELAELNDDFNNYFRSTVNSQLYVDKNLLIKRFSPISIKQINIKKNDIGRPLEDISTNIKGCTLIEDINSVISTQTVNERQIETTDGKCYLMMILPYIRSQDSKTDGAIITFNDITEIKKSKEIIEATNCKLVKINEDHDTFIYSVSHDLKAPLANMKGLLSNLKESDDSDEKNIITDMLNQSVIRLRETVEELADITRIERETENADRVNISELLEEVKLSIRDLLHQSKAKISMKLGECEIKFSKKNLRSILLNLLSNAVKYRSLDRELEIEVKCHKEEDFIHLSVEDNGLGIEKDKVNKIFSKFSRAHEGEANVEGTGIGLYLVKKIINNAGGKIEVKSKRGKGSCFDVYFRI
jgi:two-component system, chemotaxis family, CheB/CheR fusion protein